MAPSAASIIRERLKRHAARGVLQGFSETDGRSGTTVFNFRWLLGHEFSLLVDPQKNRLVVKNLLPSIDNRSFVDADLRRFIAGRADENLPEHRRLDPALATLSYNNRKRNVSLVMSVRAGGYAYAITALFTILNDLFAYLHLYHIEYLQQNFGVAEE